LFKNKQLIKKGKIQEKCISSNELVIRKRPTGGEQVPFRVQSPGRPLIVYKDYLKFILKRNNKKKEMKRGEEKHDTSRIFFSTRFLGNWCSTTSRVAKNSLVPRLHCSFTRLE